MASENLRRPVLSLVVMIVFRSGWIGRLARAGTGLGAFQLQPRLQGGLFPSAVLEIRRNFQTYGAEGLIDRLPGTRGSRPNRVSAEIEQAVLEVGGPIDSQGATCRDRTTRGCIRTARTGNVLAP